MSKQPLPAPTASAVGPCPTVIQIVGRTGTGSLPSTIAPPDHPQKVPFALVQNVWEHHRQTLNIGAIRESIGSYSFNVVIVSKKDGSIRFCIDYRKLNHRTVKGAYAISCTDDRVHPQRRREERVVLPEVLLLLRWPLRSALRSKLLHFLMKLQHQRQSQSNSFRNMPFLLRIDVKLSINSFASIKIVHVMHRLPLSWTV